MIEPGWLDPPNVVHSCYYEFPTELGREDYHRRWLCSCGKRYIVTESQHDGFYFMPIYTTDNTNPNGRD